MSWNPGRPVDNLYPCSLNANPDLLNRPRAQVVANMAVGYDNVDVEECSVEELW